MPIFWINFFCSTWRALILSWSNSEQPMRPSTTTSNPATGFWGAVLSLFSSHFANYSFNILVSGLSTSSFPPSLDVHKALFITPGCSPSLPFLLYPKAFKYIIAMTMTYPSICLLKTCFPPPPLVRHLDQNHTSNLSPRGFHFPQWLHHNGNIIILPVTLTLSSHLCHLELSLFLRATSTSCYFCLQMKKSVQTDKLTIPRLMSNTFVMQLPPWCKPYCPLQSPFKSAHLPGSLP